MSITVTSAAQSVIAEHRAFVTKTKSAFPDGGDHELVGYINLRQFGAQYTAHPAATVRTWFTVWESARIAAALRAVTTRHLDRDVNAAARRLIRQRRLWWLHAIDARLSGLNPQRLLNIYETEALRVAILIAGATTAAVERQLADDFDVDGLLADTDLADDHPNSADGIPDTDAEADQSA